ncbi:MAG: hypothetical protein PHZ02_07180 [Desulfocapsaceae bacterium]|nr:hypothetical protein [Desulfocapsaceae bacterium]
MKFFINKFPIRGIYSTEGKPLSDIQEGNAFKISGINCNMIELQPVKNIGCQLILVGADMLDIGFTETDFIDS